MVSKTEMFYFALLILIGVINMSFKKNTFAVIVGSAFAASLSVSSVVHADQNPFAMKSLSSGYMVAEADTMPVDSTATEPKMKDGKCSTGKCSASKKKAMKEKSEADTKAKEGHCSADKKAAADKAKEGNCSANKK